MKDRTSDPTTKDMGTASQGFPRKYRQHLKFIKTVETKAVIKRQETVEKALLQRSKAVRLPSKDASGSAAILPGFDASGKKLSATAQLAIVERELRKAVNHTTKSTTNKYAKRKSWMLKHKEIKKHGDAAKARRNDDDDDGENNNDEVGISNAVPANHINRGVDVEKRLVDHVEFGQVVQAPPTITAKPKSRKEYIPIPKKTFDEGHDEEDILERARRVKKQREAAVESGAYPTAKVGRRRKLKDLAPAEKIVLLREREQAIALYRQSKLVDEQSKVSK
ncbi:hypothetical protein BASA60_006246 [Batrachochytrium salamandrivorans]|nr:hypothetical protein BASA62_010225 [Batrachochytrium salamandrivorans]KAH6573078.1 hypothetical protein BASA60_006246 [Batrachochytrium salamandrivorans]KAH9268579.1 hypothetical protein BASA84_000184 [Batrachochytrium salamandrivorans]